MKKLLVLSLISLFACNIQVFSMESKNEIIEKEVCSQSNTCFVENKKDSIEEENYEKLCDCYYASFKEDPTGKKKSTLLCCFEAWAITIIREELKETNPEIFKNIDYLIYYLLGSAKQIKLKNSGWTSIKGWKNTFSDYMNGITTGNITLNDYMKMHIPDSFPRISLHKMLDVFIDIFSLSSNNEEYKRKEIMQKFFIYKLCQSINEIIEEKSYSKSNISSVKYAEDTEEYIVAILEYYYARKFFYINHYILIARDFLNSLLHWEEMKELKSTNPEIFKNIDYLIYYLLGREKQTGQKNSGGKNTFSNYMMDNFYSKGWPSSSYSFRKTSDVFIKAFSSSSSNETSNEEDEDNKKVMKTFFEYVLLRYIDKFIYNKEEFIYFTCEEITKYLSNYKKNNKSV